MTLLDKIKIRQYNIEFWAGFCLEKCQKHPKNGTRGFLVLLVDSIEKERIKYNRESKINQIINKREDIDFDDAIGELNNDYIMIYQSYGNDQELIHILKDKFQKNGLISYEQDEYF